MAIGSYMCWGLNSHSIYIYTQWEMVMNPIEGVSIMRTKGGMTISHLGSLDPGTYCFVLNEGVLKLHRRPGFCLGEISHLQSRDYRPLLYCISTRNCFPEIYGATNVILLL